MIVLCSGMQRSGSTLQYNLARVVVERAGAGCGQTESGTRFKDRPPSWDELADSSERFVFHCQHDMRRFFVGEVEYADGDRIAALGREGRLFLLHIHRDIRDACVSMHRKSGLPVEQLTRRLDSSVDCYWNVQRHVGEPWVLVQRYETVVGDLRAAVAAVADFIQVPCDASRLDEIAAECSVARSEEVIARLRRRLDSHGLGTAASENLGVNRERHFGQFGTTAFEQRTAVGLQDDSTLYHFNHVSPDRGVPGVWRTALSSDEIAILNDRFGDWLRHAGYDLPSSDENESA